MLQISKELDKIDLQNVKMVNVIRDQCAHITLERKSLYGALLTTKSMTDVASVQRDNCQRCADK